LSIHRSQPGARAAVPLNVRVVLIGSPLLILSLVRIMTKTSASFFKVKADFDNQIDRTAATAANSPR